jgi:hypothetical protein
MKTDHRQGAKSAKNEKAPQLFFSASAGRMREAKRNLVSWRLGGESFLLGKTAR